MHSVTSLAKNIKKSPGLLQSLHILKTQVTITIPIKTRFTRGNDSMLLLDTLLQFPRNPALILLEPAEPLFQQASFKIAELVYFTCKCLRSPSRGGLR